ncbi:glyceraldehyde 3-phosphate dehydrogenase [Sporodiniella umbellata]|nr:glyceraldehyde 3-phosphate dehydrogenase [Sporodiniella umbellata]
MSSNTKNSPLTTISLEDMRNKDVRYATRAGINSLGLIGVRVLIESLVNPEINVVAINDHSRSLEKIFDALCRNKILRNSGISVGKGISELYIDRQRIEVYHEKSTSSIPWDQCAVEYVMEASGKNASQKTIEGHIHAGATRVELMESLTNRPATSESKSPTKPEPSEKDAPCVSTVPAEKKSKVKLVSNDKDTPSVSTAPAKNKRKASTKTADVNKNTLRTSTTSTKKKAVAKSEPAKKKTARVSTKPTKDQPESRTKPFNNGLLLVPLIKCIDTLLMAKLVLISTPVHSHSIHSDSSSLSAVSSPEIHPRLQSKSPSTQAKPTQEILEQSIDLDLPDFVLPSLAIDRKDPLLGTDTPTANSKSRQVQEKPVESDSQLPSVRNNLLEKKATPTSESPIQSPTKPSEGKASDLASEDVDYFNTSDEAIWFKNVPISEDLMDLVSKEFGVDEKDTPDNKAHAAIDGHEGSQNEPVVIELALDELVGPIQDSERMLWPEYSPSAGHVPTPPIGDNKCTNFTSKNVHNSPIDKAASSSFERELQNRSVDHESSKESTKGLSDSESTASGTTCQSSTIDTSTTLQPDINISPSGAIKKIGAKEKTSTASTAEEPIDPTLAWAQAIANQLLSTDVSTKGLEINSIQEKKLADSSNPSTASFFDQLASEMTPFIPELDGKIKGIDIDISEEDVSTVDLTIRVEKSVSFKEVEMTIHEACKNGPLKGVLSYVEDETNPVSDQPFKPGVIQYINLVVWFSYEQRYSVRLKNLLDIQAGIDEGIK